MSYEDEAAKREKLEQEVQILEELKARREGDPLALFKPHVKQQEFIDNVLGNQYSENWFIGANRSGKTDGETYAVAKLARYGLQGDDVKYVGGGDGRVQIRDRSTSGWVSCLDFATSRDIVQPKLFDNGHLPPGQHACFIPKHEIADWHQTDQILKLKNGSIIGFKSADSGASKYQGAEKDYVCLDEEHPQSIYKESSIRVGTRKLRIFGGVTLLPPIGKSGGVSWMFPIIIKPWQEGKAKYYNIVNASIYDNPHIPLEEIRKLEEVFPPGTAENEIRLGGKLLPGLSGARAYSAFDSTIHVRTQPPMNYFKPVIWCWDFNVEPMCSCVVQKEIFQGYSLYRVHREFIVHSASLEQMCEDFYNFMPSGYREIHLYGDATGGNRSHQTGKSDYIIIMNIMRQWQVKIVKKVPALNPPVPDRINAMNSILRDTEEGSHIEIDPSCVELIADLEQVLRDSRGGIKKTTDKKDSYFYRTHMSDALGYMISYEEPVRSLRFGPGANQTIIPPSPSYRGSNAV